MALDILSLIGTVLGNRNQQAALAQQASEGGAERKLREALQQQEQTWRSSEGAADRTFQGAESAAERALREKLESERLGLTRESNELSQLGQLAQLLGQPVTSLGQADVLSLLAGRLGTPMSSARFLSPGASMVSTLNPSGGGTGGTGIGGGGRGGSWFDRTNWLNQPSDWGTSGKTRALY